MKYELIVFYQLVRKLLFRPVISGRHEGKTFILDNLHIKNATLLGCHLVYGGGSLIMEDSNIDGTNGSVFFFGKAEGTLKFLQQFDGQKMIFLTFPKSFRDLLDHSASDGGSEHA
jgi:hypothetical protein